MSLLLPRIKKIQIKMKAQEWPQHSIIDFFTQSRADNSAVKGRFWLKFGLIRDVMAILVSYKYKEDPIKIESARVATTLNINFSNTQRQITPRSEVGSG